MPTLNPLRRRGAIALLALLGLTSFAHGAAFALDLPGAAPQAPTPLPDYKPQRIGAVFQTRPDRPMATGAVRIDRLDAYLAALRQHAGNLAPRFNSAAQRAQARSDAIQLASVMGQISASPDLGTELMLRAAISLSVTGNLDAPQLGALADERFERLLAMAPEHREGLVEYGIHLVNAKRPADALPHLRRALALGNDEARWPLAVGLAALGQRREAIAELEALQTAAPRVAARYPLTDTLAAWRAAPG